jgi:hypothetical protein
MNIHINYIYIPRTYLRSSCYYLWNGNPKGPLEETQDVSIPLTTVPRTTATNHPLRTTALPSRLGTYTYVMQNILIHPGTLRHGIET